MIYNTVGHPSLPDTNRDGLQYCRPSQLVPDTNRDGLQYCRPSQFTWY